MLIIEVLSLTCISFVGLLTIAGIAIVARDLSQTQLAPGLLSRLEQEYAMPGGEMLTRVLDLVQSELQCCGISGPGDYEDTAWQAGRDRFDDGSDQFAQMNILYIVTLATKIDLQLERLDEIGAGQQL